MGTQALIARPTNPDQPQEFAGVIVGYDGYPSSVGHELLRLVRDTSGGLDAVARKLIEEHPTGWSFLTAGAPVCYCHDRGEGTDDATPVTHEHQTGIDWTYVLRTDGMEIRHWGRPVTTLPWDTDQDTTDWAAIEETA